MSKKYFSALLALATVLILNTDVPPRSAAAEPDYINPLGMEFVYIARGAFTMGSPPDEKGRADSEKQEKVVISRPFYIQTTEVTVGQWQAVMGKRWLFPRKGPENIPVTEVSWHECRAFVRKLSQRFKGTYRLPTEAEWEYACRAGTQSVYSWGNEIDCRDAMFANSPLKSDRCVPVVKTLGLKPGGPAPVKSYSPNPWGLYDMHGNLWEWCRDCFEKDRDPGMDGSFACSRQVRRGGSWYSSAHNLRSANRAWAHPATKFDTTGFRVVKEAP